MRDDRQDDHYVVSLQQEVAHLRATLKTIQELAERLRVEIAEFEHLFELERESDQRACAMWRAEDPEGRALVLPDRTNLIIWLAKKLVDIRAVLASLKAEEMEPGAWGIKCIEDHNAIIDEALGITKGGGDEDKS